MEAEKTKKKAEAKVLIQKVAKLLNENKSIPRYTCATCRKLVVYESPNTLFTFANDFDWPEQYCPDCTAHCTICDRDYPAQDKDKHGKEVNYFCSKK